MVATSLLHRDLWDDPTSDARQREILDKLAPGSQFAHLARAWLAGGRRVLFSEQQLFALQRLLIIHARDVPLDDESPDEDIFGFLRALVAIPGSMLDPDIEQLAHGGDDLPLADEAWLTFFVGHGGLLGRGGTEVGLRPSPPPI